MRCWPCSTARPSRRAQSPTPRARRPAPARAGATARAAARARVDEFIAAHGLQPVDHAEYDRLRLTLGVPDGSRDLVVEKGRCCWKAASRSCTASASPRAASSARSSPPAPSIAAWSRSGCCRCASTAPCPQPGTAGDPRRQGCRRDALRAPAIWPWRCCGWSSWPRPRSRCWPARPCSRPHRHAWLPLSVLG